MSLETLFTRYGQPSDEGRINITGYFMHPQKLSDEQHIKMCDESAVRLIKEAQQAIVDLAEYRQALADRYATLQTAPHSLRLELERYPANSFRGVLFEVRIMKKYDDGTVVPELIEEYQGKQRREALARFEELKKQRPGIEVWKDIEKARWER